ncbi:MAG: hypothetical protein WC548_01605 [Candidatus Pacearchaeota archaeon]
MTKQKWRKYEPEGRDIKNDVKMNLRTMTSPAANLLGMGKGLSRVQIDDYGDDKYIMEVGEEKVEVIAREEGQRRYTEGVFDTINSGIFLFVTEENFRNAESKLIEIFM